MRVSPVLAGMATFLLLAVVFRVAGAIPLAVFAKYWFIWGAIVQYLCSLPMDKTERQLHGHMAAIGRPLPKNRDAVLTLAKANRFLIPADLHESFDRWQVISMFLAGALLCAIVLMAISFLKFI